MDFFPALGITRLLSIWYRFHKLESICDCNLKKLHHYLFPDLMKKWNLVLNRPSTSHMDSERWLVLRETPTILSMKYHKSTTSFKCRGKEWHLDLPKQPLLTMTCYTWMTTTCAESGHCWRWTLLRVTPTTSNKKVGEWWEREVSSGPSKDNTSEDELNW